MKMNHFGHVVIWTMLNIKYGKGYEIEYAVFINEYTDTKSDCIIICILYVLCRMLMNGNGQV